MSSPRAGGHGRFGRRSPQAPDPHAAAPAAAPAEERDSMTQTGPSSRPLPTSRPTVDLAAIVAAQQDQIDDLTAIVERQQQFLDELLRAQSTQHAGRTTGRPRPTDGSNGTGRR